MIIFDKYVIHCCLLDRECWQDHREFYMPMRFHLFKLRKPESRGIMITLWEGKRAKEFWKNLPPGISKTKPIPQSLDD